LQDPRCIAFRERLVDWTVRNPKKPIAFFGQSNGSRHSVHFECFLRYAAPSTPVHVSLTAGVIFGSKTIEKTHCDEVYGSLLSSYNVYEDLKYGSDGVRFRGVG